MRRVCFALAIEERIGWRGFPPDLFIPHRLCGLCKAENVEQYGMDIDHGGHGAWRHPVVSRGASNKEAAFSQAARHA